MIRIVAPQGNNVLRNALQRVPLKRRHYHFNQKGEVAVTILPKRNRHVSR